MVVYHQGKILFIQDWMCTNVKYLQIKTRWKYFDDLISLAMECKKCDPFFFIQ